MDESKINKKHPAGRALVTPSVECYGCKVFLAFMKCFGLTFADVNRQIK